MLRYQHVDNDDDHHIFLHIFVFYDNSFVWCACSDRVSVTQWFLMKLSNKSFKTNWCIQWFYVFNIFIIHPDVTHAFGQIGCKIIQIAQCHIRFGNSYYENTKKKNGVFLESTIHFEDKHFKTNKTRKNLIVTKTFRSVLFACWRSNNPICTWTCKMWLISWDKFFVFSSFFL